MDVFASVREADSTPAIIPSPYTPTYLTCTILAVLLMAITTRLVGSFNGNSKTTATKNGHSAQTVPRVPYWLPFIGHIPSMAWDPTAFTQRLRSAYPQGIFALNLGGQVHNIISTPILATALLNQKSHVDFEAVTNKIMVNVFGLSIKDQGSWHKASTEVAACYKYLMTEPTLGAMVGETVRRLRENVVNFVSFTDSIVDQTLWERVADVKATKDLEGEDVVEASLLPLVREWVAHTANASIMGSNFLAKFPDFFEDLWTLDRGFLLMVAGLPKWFPIPMLTRAHLAQRRMLDKMCTFHEAMEADANGEDPGPDWRDLDDVSALVKERVKVYRKHDLPIRTRAVLEEILMWASNANSNALIFWMINRIYADPELLGRVREEIQPYVNAVQPKQEFPVAESPRLGSFNIDGLCSSCPLLKSCYVESLRLDTASWSLKVIQEDFVLQPRDNGAQGWLLRKGEHVHAAHDLHSTDPAHFDEPMTWKADRHIKYDESEKKATADLGTIRPYGGGTSMCKGRAFAFKESMTFVAAIVALWDIQPVGGGDWKMPRHRKATGVYGTGDNTRVWLKRRKLPQAD